MTPRSAFISPQTPTGRATAKRSAAELADAQSPSSFMTTPRKKQLFRGTVEKMKDVVHSEHQDESSGRKDVLMDLTTESPELRPRPLSHENHLRSLQVVTPDGDDNRFNDETSNRFLVERVKPKRGSGARRVLNMDMLNVPTTTVPPSPTDTATPTSLPKRDLAKPHAKRQLLFGRLATSRVFTPRNVEKVYNIIKKHTGSLGGNASCSAIYGELTMGSMQKVINLMKVHTHLNEDSLFIDVGSGIGKPNLHVAQDPGVKFSFGIEMEHDRWLLGMTCLKSVLDLATAQRSDQHSAWIPRGNSTLIDSGINIGWKCMFSHANVCDANSFDPFTHVYMFSIGFPPKLWHHLARTFNKSRSPYLICYHGPKDIIQNYQFDVELLTQTPTSMHGSKEGHTGYIYRRTKVAVVSRERKLCNVTEDYCDALFQAHLNLVESGLENLKSTVELELSLRLKSQSMTRSKTKAFGIVKSVLPKYSEN